MYDADALTNEIRSGFKIMKLGRMWYNKQVETLVEYNDAAPQPDTCSQLYIFSSVQIFGLCLWLTFYEQLNVHTHL